MKNHGQEIDRFKSIDVYYVVDSGKPEELIIRTILIRPIRE